MMNKGFIFGLLVAVFSSMGYVNAAENNTYNGLELGSKFNTKIKHKVLDDGNMASDGTLAYAYIPKVASKVTFDAYIAYLTPQSKLVAIIESSKKSDTLEQCNALTRFFDSDVVPSELNGFLNIEQLRELGYVGEFTEDLNVKSRFNPNLNHHLQFGCVPSKADATKYTFIASYSDFNLSSVAGAERDKIIATK